MSSAESNGLRFHSIDLFSGLGGNAFAFRSFATPQLYCEILHSAQVILKSAMLNGHIPTAPIHNDVTTIMKNATYVRAKAMRPLLVSGSWPCQGNSTMGLRKGMDDPRSGLIRELCDIFEDAKPEIFFVENTPEVITNGQLEYLRNRMGKLYSISWGTFTAEEMGFPHVRRRFFAVGRLRDAKVTLPPCVESLERLLPAPVEPPRMTLEEQAARVARLHALGNSVVPAAILYGFLTLMKVDVKKPRGARALDLVIAPEYYAPPEGLQLSALVKQSGLVAEPISKTRWSTPRAGMHGACHVLTDRSSRDLPTMIRFERNTPDELRGGFMAVAWNEWLMGYPVGYTNVTDPALLEELEGAPRESRPGRPRVSRSRVHHEEDDLPMPKMSKTQRFAFLEEEEEEVTVAYETKVAELRSARDARLAARKGGNSSEMTVPV